MTYLIMEWCDRGSLADALRLGLLHEPPPTQSPHQTPTSSPPLRAVPGEGAVDAPGVGPTSGREGGERLEGPHVHLMSTATSLHGAAAASSMAAVQAVLADSLPLQRQGRSGLGPAAAEGEEGAQALFRGQGQAQHRRTAEEGLLGPEGSCRQVAPAVRGPPKLLQVTHLNTNTY